MICVGIYAVLVNNMIIADNLHSAIFSLAAYTVILCFSLFKSGRTGEVDILRALAACQGQGGDFQSEAAKYDPTLTRITPI